MKTITVKEAEERLGISPEQLDEWEHDATRGMLHGEPRGDVTGRPLLFGEETKQMGISKRVLPAPLAIVD